MLQRRLPQPLPRLLPWRQPDRPLPGLVINLEGTDIFTAPAAAVDGPSTALDFDVLGMPFVSQEERPYGDLLLAFSYHVVLAHDGRLGFVSASSISGSRLHHWLPSSPGAQISCGTKFRASTPPRVARSLWM